MRPKDKKHSKDKIIPKGLGTIGTLVQSSSSVLASKIISPQVIKSANQTTHTKKGIALQALTAIPIQVGYYAVLKPDICKVLPSCAYSNPISTYGRSIFTTFPINSSTSLDIATIAGATSLTNYEAIVIWGIPPPTSAYWSYTPYLYDRLLPDGSRFVYYASLTDSFDNYDVIKGTTISKLAIIMTLNETIMSILTNLFSDYYVIQLKVPNVLQDTDRVAYLQRISLPKSKSSLTSYEFNPKSYTIKITFPSTMNFSPYCINIPGSGTGYGYQGQINGSPADSACLTFKTRPNSPNEIAKYSTGYNIFLSSVKNGLTILKTINFAPYLDNINTGYDCINKGIDCYADTRDSTYSQATNSSGSSITLPSNSYALIVAVNHHCTCKAIYCSITAYDTTNQSSVGFHIPCTNPSVCPCLSMGQYGNPSPSQPPCPSTSPFYIVTAGYGSQYTINIPTSTTQLVFGERSYIQLPENIGPDNASLIFPTLYIVSGSLPSTSTTA